jgi:AraC-like DNA-binding protein
MRLDRNYEPHLTIHESLLAPGSEWSPRLFGWSLILINAGNGYLLHPKINQELEPGMALLLSPATPGSIRASQLGGLTVTFFSVEPERLTGLITLKEQHFFGSAASRDELAVRVLLPGSAVALRLRGLCAERNRNGSLVRLQLLQLFFEAFGLGPEETTPKAESALDARERLEEFLRQRPASDLLALDFGELARMTRCTPRHLSRIFQQVVGSSFRDKHTELRLSRARELLATTESKVVDVAMESGYQSLSLFNQMFTRRFGMSPGRWRQTYRNNKTGTGRTRQKALLVRQ